MPKIKAVLFDMDGLMFDTESMYYRANQATADSIGMPFDYPFYERYIGASDKDFFAAIRSEQTDKHLANRFIEQSKIDIEKALLEKALPKKLGLEKLLEYLKSQNIEMIVASSTERNMVEKLVNNAGLSKYFTEIVGGDGVKDSKPDPAIFLKALSKTTATPSEALVLEDSLNGVRAAHAAGIPVIMIPDLISPNEEAKEKATDILPDLTKVIEYIEN
ncbi:HAD family hydrolase [Marinilactibacillus psychrotolerans]|uniref:HAD family hydrolase n=1 Tax=Marinilactibacillus psychrotolerans TaxID=191770 RepID=UPI00186627C6|nr:HAD family phosphatase [Marinilactibacillus psychrotolerans]